jgi:16S rRNA A1518/A1519 N6-dimethyltransferase RsmA/KsgA/DIM1 with predicted DNA glycosylase/AP lyase activity
MGQNLSSKSEERQSVRSDLRQLVSFCRAEPQRAWTTSDLGKGELTLRLLRFCTSLQAFEEGFQLLKILGSDFDSENFEGIQNEQVAQAIADFVSQVTGKTLFNIKF